MHSSLDLDLLPVFAVFADTLSFTETARRLHSTQPTVHGQIKRLTDALKAPLYLREGRSLELTARGRALAALARQVVAQRDAFLSETPRRWRLAAGRGTWTGWLAPVVTEEVANGLVEPVLADGSTAIEGVQTGQFDLGIATRPVVEGLERRELRRIGTVVLVHPSDPLAGRPSVSLADLADRSWVLPSAGRPHRLVVEALLRQRGLSWSVAAQADDWRVAACFVAMGCGISAVNATVEAPGCVRIPLSDGPISTVSLFWRADPELNTLADALAARVPHQTAS